MAPSLWDKVALQLEKELNSHNYNTWICPIKYESIDDNFLNISVPNKFFSDWIKDNYKNKIESILNNILNNNIKLNINISNIMMNQENKEEIKIEEKKDHIKITNNTLNNKYTFDSFVSGTSNQFAHAAAMAVANNPATTYNPLFIYGGVGLGKTHIINAIGNYIHEKNNNAKIAYYSSEKFMNELINSLRYAKMEDFRNKFRSMDVLLIDDIQFIAGKERTQEEFFHTFNALYESHKQIIVTSDKFPKEIPGLEERLRSRFEWGLIADIQAPDVETKLAILKMKADQNGINIPEDVGFFLANSITSNVRELEGYLVRVGAYASLTSTPINMEMAKNILKDILVEQNREITIETIQKIVANHFNVKTIELKSSKRLKTLVLPRQIAMYISRKMTSCSFPEIGNRFGGKDHSTVIHAIKKIDQKMVEDIQLKTTVERLMDNMRS
ncbi:chromosomal replication initiator protein DnaA [Geopsychrobacter electrodiphilus]|uniref:chromosomal replication initiator protein DnaA n=1 Tax=Geopsychrobacter electrodiphilus TaxID=225196 RepID=UPI000370B539|nr:chromosomal replication initiator protein DnaA [Geopsychrobacter electrodiphilus]